MQKNYDVSKMFLKIQDILHWLINHSLSLVISAVNKGGKLLAEEKMLSAAIIPESLLQEKQRCCALDVPSLYMKLFIWTLKIS